MKFLHSSTTKRKSNFELLRIIAIIMVVVSHFNVHSGFSSQNLSPTNFFLTKYFTLGCIANFIFILITGFFMIKAKPNFKKIFRILGEMYFYSLVLFVIAIIFGRNNISSRELLATFLPFPFGNWFCVMYIIILTISPIINKTIYALGKKKHLLYIALLVIFFSIIPCIPVVHDFLENLSMPLVGYRIFPHLQNFVAFILGYSIGAFLRIYDCAKKRRLDVVTLLIILAVFTLCAIINNDVLQLLSSNISIYVIVVSTLVFKIFKNIDIGSCRIINTAAASVLGIYLIHENIFVRYVIWRSIGMADYVSMNVVQFCVWCIVKVLIVFLICLGIDMAKKIILRGVFDKNRVNRQK